MPSGYVFADLDLARRLEATDAWVGLESSQIHAGLHPASGSAAAPIAGGYAVFTGVGSPLTQALGIGMNGIVTEADLDQLEEFFYRRGSPVHIELCPLADGSLLHLMSQRGYTLRGYTNMLVRPIRPAEPGGPAATNINVRTCEPEEATVWARTVAQGFAEAVVVSDENLDVLLSLFHRPNAQCVIAWMGERAAGAGAFSTHEGIAALYGASTLHQFRRQGVQSAIIRRLLANASGAKCDLAYTLTHPGSISQRSVIRQGFQVAYTRSTMVHPVPVQSSP